MRCEPAAGASCSTPATREATAHGSFVPPTLIEIGRLAELEREVFGPVLHVLRYDREDLAALLGQINATGYGLTLGVHTRIDETVAQVVEAAHAGNIYVNRNVVGAVVGVQPFGGEGLSGTGPKAGGPLYLLRLLAARPDEEARAAVLASGPEAIAPIRGLPMGDEGTDPALARPAPLGPGAAAGRAGRLDRGDRPLRRAFAGRPLAFPPRPDRRSQPLRDGAAPGRALPGRGRRRPADPARRGARRRQPRPLAELGRPGLAAAARGSARPGRPGRRLDRPADRFDAVLHHGSRDELLQVLRRVAARPGPIVGVTALGVGDMAIPLERLVVERSLSINTAAAGGNASLMTMG